VSLDAYTVDHGDEGYEVSGVVNVPLADNVALRVVGFSARDAGFIDNIFGTSLGGTFDNAEFVEDDVNHSEHLGGRAALRWLPNENWTVDAGVVYQQMRANSYAEEDLSNGINGHTELAGRELSVVRFLDESRSDEWTQLALTLQGDLGFAQFTSATSYFTRRIAYHQDNTDYTFYLSHAFGANYAVYDLGPDPVASAGATGPLPTASPRNSACRARRRSSPGSRGSSTSTSTRASISSAASRTTRTRRASRRGSTTRSTTTRIRSSPARPTTRSITRRTTRRRSSTRPSAS
jgi:hypothetical protein